MNQRIRHPGLAGKLATAAGAAAHIRPGTRPGWNWPTA